ncbi:hypothetical protein FAVG1_13087 [Fusarium avenaceum]|nr:hypothetical protein FAVG1_13087 [Fusarium avenaceum]
MVALVLVPCSLLLVTSLVHRHSATQPPHSLAHLFPQLHLQAKPRLNYASSHRHPPTPMSHNSAKTRRLSFFSLPSESPSFALSSESLVAIVRTVLPSPVMAPGQPAKRSARTRTRRSSAPLPNSKSDSDSDPDREYQASDFDSGDVEQEQEPSSTDRSPDATAPAPAPFSMTNQNNARKAKVARQIKNLIGVFPWVWLGPLSPPTWGSSFLEKLRKILTDNLTDIEAGHDRDARLLLIKLWLRDHAEKRAKDGEPARIGINDVEAAAHGMDLQSREQSVPLSTAGSFHDHDTVEPQDQPTPAPAPATPTPATTVSQASPAVQVSRKRPASASLPSNHAAKASRLSVSTPSVVRTISHFDASTASPSVMFHQWHTTLSTHIANTAYNVEKLRSDINQDIQRTRDDSLRWESQLPDLAAPNERVNTLTSELDSLRAHLATQTAADSQAARDKTSSDIDAKQTELDLAAKQLKEMTGNHHLTEQLIAGAATKRDKLTKQVEEYTEYSSFFSNFGRIFDAGPAGMHNLTAALADKGLNLDHVIGDGPDENGDNEREEEQDRQDE